MATSTVNESSEALELGHDSPRVRLCTEATYQIEAMIDALAKAARDDGERESLPYLVQGIAHRISELNGIIMCALNDTGSTELSLSVRLYGKDADAANSEEVAHG